MQDILDLLTKQQHELLDQIDQLELKIQALEQAKQALAGSGVTGSPVRNNEEVRRKDLGRVEVQPVQIPPSYDVPRRPPEPVDTRLPCPACGGRLESGTRTLSNGKVVNLLMCTDSGCNHEQF